MRHPLWTLTNEEDWEDALDETEEVEEDNPDKALD
jgi:hypothetical protein